MPICDINYNINYKLKCYTIENEKLFGDIIITHQTPKKLYTVNNWQIPKVHQVQIQNQNLTKYTIDTPDFMAINKLMTKNNNKNKNREIIFSNNNKHKKFNNNQQCKINDDFVKKQKIYPLPVVRESHEGVVISSLVDQLLSDIYRCSKSEFERSESESTVSSFRPHLKHRYLQRTRLQFKCKI
ncbi:hypothetical protein PV327_004231 [Microctonus hyperodae]|uniref:Uncharacterized protein n=1 Tax=Microctonus hyperodae TaxID=165561 RepID=A0AA39FBY3_MICHY|nr:hypothetical protein PV327_004231 [Microctonus hyperodae]